MKFMKLFLVFSFVLLFSGCSEERVINESFSTTIKENEITSNSSEVFDNGTAATNSDSSDTVENNTQNEENWIWLNSHIKANKINIDPINDLGVYQYQKDAYNKDVLIDMFSSPPDITENESNIGQMFNMAGQDGSGAYIDSGTALYYSSNGMVTSAVGGASTSGSTYLPESQFTPIDSAVEESEQKLKDLGLSSDLVLFDISYFSKEEYKDWISEELESLSAEDEKDSSKYQLFSSANPCDFYRMTFSLVIDSIPLLSDSQLYSTGIQSDVFGPSIEINYTENGIESLYVCSTINTSNRVDGLIKYSTIEDAENLLVNKFDNMLISEVIRVNNATVVYCPLPDNQLVPCWVFYITYEESQVDGYVIFNAENGDEIY